MRVPRNEALHIDLIEQLKLTIMLRETISSFKGYNNVTKITRDDNSVAYLSSSTPFADAADSMGACKLNTYENANKHVLFLYNAQDAEVGRLYLTKKLQGKTPDEIAELKHSLILYHSYVEEKGWVPCITISSQESLAKTAVTF